VRGTVLYAPGDVPVEERGKRAIEAPTDAIVKSPAVPVCGRNLWPYRGVEPVDGPRRCGSRGQ
jgi:threonine dehydrogenase-like Zn-dependent dehydrogenase